MILISGVEAPDLAKLAARMIKSGFVIHREFESCFEMGNGAEVMALLVDMALEDDELRDWWQRGEYYIGDFEQIKARVLARNESLSPDSVSAQLQLI